MVEILIVVVILGILAAIVIPQFSQASLEAREASLISNLQTMRSQIELYKIQHLEVLPADAAALTTALTTQTQINGTAWAAGSGTAFGPYMREIPDNPFTTRNVIGDAGDGTGTAVDWEYVPNVAQGTYTFKADDGLDSPNGTAHVDL